MAEDEENMSVAALAVVTAAREMAACNMIMKTS